MAEAMCMFWPTGNLSATTDVFINDGTSNDKSAVIKMRRRLSLTHVSAFVVRENALIGQPLRDCLQFVVPCLKERDKISREIS